MKRLVAATILFLTAAFAVDTALPLIQPKDVAASLSATNKPAIIYVGPGIMYRSKHIPGAVFAGPGNRPEGLELLKAAVKSLPHSGQIVIYCGCCPWEHCPNIDPAFAALKKMGFTNVKVMYEPTGFKADWIDRGYPVE